jgi:hypothetical protein
MRYYTILGLLFLALNSNAQVKHKTVSGRLTDSDGMPMPGVNVVIKGTQIGTSTDADGSYSIDAPIGAVLVFSFVGMTTKEVVVTDDVTAPIKKNTGKKDRDKKDNLENDKTSSASWAPFILKDSSESPAEGVAVLSDASPVYSTGGQHLIPDAIMRIRKLHRGSNRDESYLIRINAEPRRRGIGLQFTSSFGLEWITQLPALQTAFSQGRSVDGELQWRGPHTGELFSWGPRISELEFKNGPYDFDRNGELVQAGTGNGRKAKSYRSTDFFTTGYHVDNDLIVSLPGPLKSILKMDLLRKYNSGVVPGSSYERHILSVQLRNLKFVRNFNMDASLTYNDSRGHLMNRGANQATILGSILRTPPTFDNTNGMTTRRAFSSKSAYVLENGTPRSFAPVFADNPFGLANTLLDRETGNRLMASTALTYAPGRFNVTWSAGADRQTNALVTGLKPGSEGFPTGRRTNRTDEEIYFNSVLSPSMAFYLFDEKELKITIAHHFHSYERNLSRHDGFHFTDDSWKNMQQADSLTSLSVHRSRQIHELAANIKYSQRGFMLRLINQSYFSSTLSRKDYVNLFPSASFQLRVQEIAELYPLSELTLYGSGSRSPREAPLVYSNWSYLSTQRAVSQYPGFFESREIVSTSGLRPEVDTKFEVGGKISSQSVSADFSWYTNTTDDFLAPFGNGNDFSFANIAKVRNVGTIVSVAFHPYNDGEVNYQLKLRWDKLTSVVRSLYADDSFIPLAGFNTTASVLAEGKPLGAIYGTTWKRNSHGDRIIGADGFPVESETLHQIGSPIPDWNLSFESLIDWRNFKLTLVIDLRKGGDVWNGTRAMLDYYGRSASSGRQRDIRGFVFRGVDENGVVNNIPVNFYDASSPIDANRWVRYGADGVGEAYIEDGTSLRLSQTVLSYFLRVRDKKINEVKFSIIAQNLFQFTPYSGVDPATSLFGYSSGNGLDLFNMPSTRSVSAQVVIKI